MTRPTANEWHVARESVEWVGPIAFTVTNRHTGLPVTPNLAIAVVLRGDRPAAGDWVAPTADPDGTGQLGFMTAAVDAGARMGVWARDTDNPETPVLEPWQVGYLTRT